MLHESASDSNLKSSTISKSSIEPEQLKWWFPVDAVIDGGRPAVEWMDMRDVTFNEPFFHETIERVKGKRCSESVVTDLDFLLQMEKICDNVEPAGLSFHTSRCGSTLLANACRALRGSIVISEAPVLDKLASRSLLTPSPTQQKNCYTCFLPQSGCDSTWSTSNGNRE